MSAAGHFDFHEFTRRTHTGGSSSPLPSPSQLAHQLLTSPLRSPERYGPGEAQSSTSTSPTPPSSSPSATVATPLNGPTLPQLDASATSGLWLTRRRPSTKRSEITRLLFAATGFSRPVSSMTTATSAKTPGSSFSTIALDEVAGIVWGQMKWPVQR